MIELIRQSAVPANVMRSAARGALSLPQPEIVEILVFLTQHSIFGEQATLTLAGWDQQALATVAADPDTPQEVLTYLSSPRNVRANLLPGLVENPSVGEDSIAELAHSGSREVLTTLLGSARVRTLPKVLRALAENPQLTPAEHAGVERALAESGGSGHHEDSSIDEEIARYAAEHADEIAAHQDKGFELVESSEEERHELAAHAAAAPAHTKREDTSNDRLSTLQRIAKLTVGGRVQLAMKGSREERFLLIRDGAKVVSSAVLESPKLTDQEVETFAAMKNVQETVLRGIASKRKFMKLYPVVRALVNNPRCPLDVSLPLMKGLLVADLKTLSMNKNVPDTLKKLAFKMFKEKSSEKAHS